MGRSKRAAGFTTVALLVALTGVLLTSSDAFGAARAQTLTNGQTLSVRSGDSCVVTPTAPKSGRKLLRNFLCKPAAKPGPPPTQPAAPRIQTLYAGDTLSVRSGDGCRLTPFAPSGGKNRNFRCVPPAPPPRTAGGSTKAGAVVGNAKYPVPAGAIIVSPTGNDAAAGTSAAPLRTLNRAVAKAAAGATIVMRAGSYHESVVIEKQLTIQAWPKEGVWLDGSSPVVGWAALGGDWVKSGWTVEFDASPTYTRGAPDGTTAGWRFVNADHPMAAHPDQIWIDGVAQRQVGSRTEVVPGTFFHDEAANQLWLGSDPNGKQVRASDLVAALNVRARSVILRGFGVRRYAPSVPDMGAVTLERSGILAENLVIFDSATTGLHVGAQTTAANVQLRNIWIARSGMLGLSASFADNLLVDKVIAESNNTEHFNEAPVAGGAKLHSLRTATVRDSIFRDNDGTGLWLDESVYDMALTGNDIVRNTGDGAALELSSTAVFANNFVTNNGEFGLKVNNTSHVSVWNNTFVGNGRSINIVQDSRQPTSATTTGRDNRQPFPDPTMTWVNGPVDIADNIIANQQSGECMLCVEDYSHQRSAAQFGITANGNIYNRTVSNLPSWLVVWSRGAGDPAVYTTLDSFRSGTGQESAGQYFGGAAIVDGAGAPITTTPNSALALPAAVAAAAGKATGTKHQGAWPH